MINTSKKVVKYAHSVVFHNLHDKHSIKLHGSISKNKLIKIIIYLKKNYNLLDADIYLKKIINNNLKKKDVCLSFDDGLKSQFDIAIPVLEKYKLKAFFFVFSESFQNKISNLELYKYFRSTEYIRINNFYNDFFLISKNFFNINLIKKEFETSKYLNEFKFYTKIDRFFRYLRDKILSENHYNLIMKTMMKNKKFKPSLVSKKLYLSINELKIIHQSKHIIGLHSHSHPTNIDSISYQKQYNEYQKNKKLIEKLLKNKIIIMAHPCGKYNKETIKVLKKLYIKAGFGTQINNNKELFNLSRLDCAYL